MRSILEFALFAWVGISVIAVLVQLVRIARYKRATTSSPAAAPKKLQDTPTINLDQRLGSTESPATPEPGTAGPGPAGAEPPPTAAMASTAAPVADRAADAQAQPATPSTSFTAPASAPAPVAPPSATQPSAATAPPSSAPPSPASPSSAPLATPENNPNGAEATPAPAPQQAAPTLADLLAGVRLPWNLLPTVDQSREPSNDRVVLITNEGQPADIGIDVADELERLGFTIAPRGDDTAIATRGDHSLGLQIIENPMDAQIEGTRRFPTATESSVALDIWIDS